MADTKIVSFSKFKQGRGGEPSETQVEAPAKRGKSVLVSKAVWCVIVEVVRFGVLAGSAWMLFSRPMALWEYGDWVWVLGWIAYPVIGAWLVAHAMDFGFHSFLLNCLYFVGGVTLLFYETWLGVVVLLPYVALIVPSFSGQGYVVRPF